MAIHILAIGKTHSDYTHIVTDYLARMRRYSTIQLQCLKEKKWPESKKTESIKRCQKNLLAQCPSNALRIALDKSGHAFSSETFADFLHTKRQMGRPLYFLIGNAFGFTDDFLKECDASISLSALTFSHQMVRIIFLEQLYRAFEIGRGSCYHK